MGASAKRRRTALCAALALLVAPASAGAATIYTVDNSAPPLLQTFDSSAPASTLTTLGPITGMQPGERLASIDFEPNGPRLYGIGSNKRLYRINATTLVATAVSATPLALSPSVPEALGMDFDPVSGLIRVVTDSKQNMRVSTVTGKEQATDATLQPGDGTTAPVP